MGAERAGAVHDATEAFDGLDRATAPAPVGPPTVARVLALQATAGNATVARMLGARGGRMLQRFPGLASSRLVWIYDSQEEDLPTRFLDDAEIPRAVVLSRSDPEAGRPRITIRLEGATYYVNAADVTFVEREGPAPGEPPPDALGAEALGPPPMWAVPPPPDAPGAQPSFKLLDHVRVSTQTTSEEGIELSTEDVFRVFKVDGAAVEVIAPKPSVGGYEAATLRVEARHLAPAEAPAESTWTFKAAGVLKRAVPTRIGGTPVTLPEGTYCVAHLGGGPAAFPNMSVTVKALPRGTGASGALKVGAVAAVPKAAVGPEPAVHNVGGDPANPDKPRLEGVRYTQITGQVFYGEPRPDDVEQGHLGDCAYLAGVLAFAHSPAGRLRLRSMIRPHGAAKQYIVSGLSSIDGEPLPPVTVSCWLPTYDDDGAERFAFALGDRDIRDALAENPELVDTIALWPLILEKALASARLPPGQVMDYESLALGGLAWDSRRESMSMLTGGAAEFQVRGVEPAAVGAWLGEHVGQPGDAVTAGTPQGGPFDVSGGQQLFGRHAYAVIGFDGAEVRLHNPHGIELTITLDEFAAHFVSATLGGIPAPVAGAGAEPDAALSIRLPAAEVELAELERMLRDGSALVTARPRRDGAQRATPVHRGGAWVVEAGEPISKRHGVRVEDERPAPPDLDPIAALSWSLDRPYFDAAPGARTLSGEAGEVDHARGIVTISLADVNAESAQHFRVVYFVSQELSETPPLERGVTYRVERVDGSLVCLRAVEGGPEHALEFSRFGTIFDTVRSLPRA